MNIYRNVIDGMLYTAEHLIKDIHHLNNNAFSGIYFHPYKHNSEIIKFISDDFTECLEFMLKNFEIVAST